MASNKLKPYFETHPIVVRTNYPLKSVMRKTEFTGCMEKWVINLSGYEIGYEPRTTIKSQALADFVVDFSPTLEHEASKETAILTNDEPIGTWTLHTDGSSNIRGTGLGVILKLPQGKI